MVEFVEFPKISDDRGSLIPVEFEKFLPFVCKRAYFLTGLQTQLRRGFHAHKELQQVFFCIQGSCKILMDDGKMKDNYEIEGTKAIVIDKMVWHEMYEFSKDCVIAVFASDIYKESDYIRDYADFTKYVGEK